MPIGCGIELTADAVRGVLIERVGTSRALRCLAVQEVPCDGTDSDALTRALERLQRTLHVRQPVVLGLPPHASILLTVDPLVPNPQRDSLALQFELQQHLPYAVANASWHYGWLVPHRMARGTGHGSAVLSPQLPALEQHPDAARPPGAGAVVAAIRGQLVQERLSACRRAGITVGAVTISSLGVLSAYAATHTEGAVMLARWTSATATEWILALPDRISVIPMVASSLETFPQEWVASWEALRADVPQAPEEPTLLDAPAWAHPPDESLPVPQVWTGEELFRGAQMRVEHPERYVAAAGLAMQDVGMAAYSLNLIAGTQEAQRDARFQRVASTVTSVCVAAGMAFAVSGMHQLRQRNLQVLELLTQREQLYQALRPEIRQHLQQQERVQGRAAQLAHIAGAGPRVVRTLAQVAEALPDEVWLTRMECAHDTGVEVLLEGRATSFQDVTRFLDRLKSVEGITAVKPLSTTVIADPTSGKELVAFSAQVLRAVTP